MVTCFSSHLWTRVTPDYVLDLKKLSHWMLNGVASHCCETYSSQALLHVWISRIFKRCRRWQGRGRNPRALQKCYSYNITASWTFTFSRFKIPECGHRTCNTGDLAISRFQDLNVNTHARAKKGLCELRLYLEDAIAYPQRQIRVWVYGGWMWAPQGDREEV